MWLTMIFQVQHMINYDNISGAACDLITFQVQHVINYDISGATYDQLW